METKNYITDAELSLMRQCAQCPWSPLFAEDIKIFRTLTEEALGKNITLINCKFI